MIFLFCSCFTLCLGSPVGTYPTLVLGHHLEVIRIQNWVINNENHLSSLIITFIHFWEFHARIFLLKVASIACVVVILGTPQYTELLFIVPKCVIWHVVVLLSVTLFNKSSKNFQCLCLILHLTFVINCHWFV